MNRFVISLFTLIFLVVASSDALYAQTLTAAGGSGDAGGDGGSIELAANRGVLAGGSAKVKLPKDPKVQTKGSLIATDTDISGTISVAELDASAGDLDPDLFEVTTAGNFILPAGRTLDLEGDVQITSTRGGVYVAGTIQDADGGDNGVNLALRSLRRPVVVTGSIDVAGEDASNGGDGGDVDLIGLLVSVGGTATINASGGSTTAGNDGGRGGDVTVESFDAAIQEKRVAVAFGPNTTVDLRGGDGDTGGDGGNFDVDYSNVLGSRSTLTLTGDIDVRGGAGIAGGNQAGDGGDIEGDVGSSIYLAGTLDARGGNGATGSDGGAGGRVRFGARGVSSRRIAVLGDALTNGLPVSTSVSGGAGNVDNGGVGGSVDVVADQGAIRWVGSTSAAGGASTDGDGADGGDVLVATYGSRRADILITGDVDVSGSDGGTNGAGGAGGSVEIISLDSAIALVGDIDASAGDAAGNGNDANSAGGTVAILVDDTVSDPTTGAGGIDLLDDVGRTISVDGNITTAGGAGGGGDSDGSAGGEIIIDADADDGEERTNGNATLVAGSTISTVGGAGTGAGANGDGGDVTLRASNRTGVNAASGFVVGAGATVTSAAGGAGAADGTQTID